MRPEPTAKPNVEQAFVAIQGLVNERISALKDTPITQQAVRGLAQELLWVLHDALFPREGSNGG